MSDNQKFVAPRPWPSRLADLLLAINERDDDEDDGESYTSEQLMTLVELAELAGVGNSRAHIPREHRCTRFGAHAFGAWTHSYNGSQERHCGDCYIKEHRDTPDDIKCALLRTEEQRAADAIKLAERNRIIREMRPPLVARVRSLRADWASFKVTHSPSRIDGFPPTITVTGRGDTRAMYSAIIDYLDEPAVMGLRCPVTHDEKGLNVFLPTTHTPFLEIRGAYLTGGVIVYEDSPKASLKNEHGPT